MELLIGGARRGAAKGATFERLDPVTGTVASRAPAATLEDATAAVDAAAGAFPAWSATSPGERRAKLLKAADLMDARAPDFIRVGVAETGGTAGWYGFNVMLAANMLREAAAMTTQITGELIPSNVPGSLAMAVRQPAGVVLGIAPWNAPVILATRAMALPLACGNTVVLKASEACPGVHVMIGEVLVEAGLGEGIVNVITNAPADAPDLVAALIRDPRVRRVNFTGSTRVGRIVGRLAAEYLKPAVLELGGKAPFLVLDDADLEAARDGAVFGAFMNQGQICMSTERLVVDKTIADRFVSMVADKASTLKAGNPAENNTPLGALFSPESAAHCRELIDDAVSKGARIACGGQIEGTIMQPTVIDGVTREMRLYGEESFGNLVSVIRVDGEEQAIAVANDTGYGLSAAVFSRDVSRAWRVAARIESGICHINGPTVHDEAQMPFGGVKDSGYGRFGGKAGIAEFTELRWITIQNEPRHYPF
ncbi:MULTISPECIES: aldehyde dehydrogenase [unclassified Luteimonas]